jgi:CheY-like chemotaxis protein
MPAPRRRILVVDNEEADRELLVHLLEPLGFECALPPAAMTALDLLATGYRPEAILMDLAMPGIDGWETIRRVRALGLAQVHVAIVSANAFDKGWSMMWRCRPKTSSSSRCAIPSCWTGWSAGWG